MAARSVAIHPLDRDARDIQKLVQSLDFGLPNGICYYDLVSGGPMIPVTFSTLLISSLIFPVLYDVNHFFDVLKEVTFSFYSRPGGIKLDEFLMVVMNSLLLMAIVNPTFIKQYLCSTCFFCLRLERTALLLTLMRFLLYLVFFHPWEAYVLVSTFGAQFFSC